VQVTHDAGLRGPKQWRSPSRGRLHSAESSPPWCGGVGLRWLRGCVSGVVVSVDSSFFLWFLDFFNGLYHFDPSSYYLLVFGGDCLHLISHVAISER
jgi:hypothetical protein